MVKRYRVKFHRALIPAYLIWGILIVEFFLSLIGLQWINAAIAFATFFLTLIPLALQEKFNLNIPKHFLVAIIFFISATLFFGEVSDFYERFWWWDIVLHGGSAIGFGILGFVIMLYLSQSSKIIASPFLVSLFSFSFAIAIGVLWELFEFAMDQTFGLNMQKSGLVDTMTDLAINGIGGIIASVAGYFYLQYGPDGFLSALIHPVFKENMRHFRSKIKILRRFHKTANEVTEELSIESK